MNNEYFINTASYLALTYELIQVQKKKPDYLSGFLIVKYY